MHAPIQDSETALVINGVTVPTPASLQIGYQDVDFDSGRLANGDMERNRVGVKVKLSITWPPMGRADVKKVVNACEPQFFNVTYLDPKTDSRQTKVMYAGDRTVPVYNYTLGLYDSMSYDVIEK